METTHIKEALQSKKYKKVVIVFGIALVLLMVFRAGMQVGYQKASFSYQFGESYYRSFGPDGGHPMGLVPGDVSNAHGASGPIMSISLPTIVVADSDRTEKIVRIDDETVIRLFRDTISPADLRVGDGVVIIGSPNERAEIGARFIRVVPNPVQ